MFWETPDVFYFLGIDWGGQGKAEVYGGAEPCSLGESCWLLGSPWRPLCLAIAWLVSDGNLLPSSQKESLPLPQLRPIMTEEEG